MGPLLRDYQVNKTSHVKKKSLVFFGTFLSAQTGSRPSSETIATALSERGYAVTIVSRKSMAPFRILDSLWIAWTIQADLAVLDVFSSRVHRLTSVIAGILVWRSIPFISVLQGGALLEKFDEIKLTLEPVLQDSSRIISPSNFLCAGFEERGYSVERVPNALKLDHFPYRERQQTRGTIPLLWVRAFTEIYRPHWPVEIVWHLRRNGISSRLTMVGPDKGLLGAAKARADELSVTDSIEFVGPVPNDKLFEYFHSHDYLLNTTQFESFGVALAESAATGLPIVSAAVGEVKHSWKDDEDIFLVPGDSSREFADRIAGLCDNDQDGLKYRHVSRTAREKVSDFAMANILPRWECMIESLCDDRAR